jgi:hypothetical protein
MATVSANYGLDINLVDFNVMADGDASFSSNLCARRVRRRHDARHVHRHRHHRQLQHRRGDRRTVTGYKEEFLSNGSWMADWSMQGMAPVSAVAVYKRILSAGTADDMALLAGVADDDVRLATAARATTRSTADWATTR